MIFLLSIIDTKVSAQEMDAEYTINYLNKRTTEACKIFSSKKDIRIEFYSNGNPVRIDYVFPSTIDFENGITYSPDDQSISIKCYEKAGKQVERNILKNGSKLFYDRSNLLVNCTGEDCDAIVTAMKHLIQLYAVDDYERSKPFEEN
ncbi:MAG: hypothetical protein R2813_08150 [Flavobacteriales bacterium]